MANNLLHLPSRPTAIIVLNDLLAIGALHAIRMAGLSVPGDMSVVGFDNIHLSSYTNPPLTTECHQFLLDKANTLWQSSEELTKF